MAFQRIFQKLLNFGVLAAFFALLKERARPIDCVNQICARVLKSFCFMEPSQCCVGKYLNNQPRAGEGGSEGLLAPL